MDIGDDHFSGCKTLKQNEMDGFLFGRYPFETKKGLTKKGPALLLAFLAKLQRIANPSGFSPGGWPRPRRVDLARFRIPIWQLQSFPCSPIG